MPARARGLGLLGRAGYPESFVQRAPQDPTPDPSNSVASETPMTPAPTSPSPTPSDPGQTPPTGNTNSDGGNGHTTPGSNPPPVPTPTPSVSLGQSTAADGSIIWVSQTVIVTPPAPPPTNSTPAKSGGGISTATITGLAVAGGVAAVAIIAFIVWKWMASRKRFSEFDADEIKWPELKDEAHALPARPTGRHGAGLDGEDDATIAGSAYGSTAGKGPYGPGHSHNDSASQLLPAASYSASTGYPPTQFSHYSDNPTPYSDNPTAGYHDPYGAAPGAAAVMAGRQSPGPGVAYGAPGPGAAYGGRAASPGPGGAYGPRAGSPGPGVAYGGRAVSPGPGAAYGGRAASPGPGAAYGGYDTGRPSPGPQQAYGGV